LRPDIGWRLTIRRRVASTAPADEVANAGGMAAAD